MEDYKVELENYAGPLELLLHLIKENEMDVLNISIARVTEQYLAYIKAMALLDLNVAGEYLVLAARLVEIKSRELLPGEPLGDEEEDGDPRDELVRHLLLYQKVREVALELSSRRASWGDRFVLHAPAPVAAGEPADPPLLPVGLWELVSAFQKILRETGAGLDRHIEYKDIPVKRYMELILERLHRESPVPFRGFLPGELTKLVVIGLFLACLELVKMSRVLLVQDRDFGEISLALAESSRGLPLHTYEITSAEEGPVS